MREIIKLEKVVKMYSRGVRAVNEVSFSICDMDHILIHGDPGSGKSTLMRLICGLEAPNDGKIFVMDRALHEMTAEEASDFRNQNFGFLQREPSFMNRLNLLENVALPLVVRGVPARKRITAAKQLLKEYGLLYAAQAYPEQISTYEAQKASIARALIAQPKILLLEEINAGLSIKETDEINGMVQELWKSGNYVIISFSGTKKCGMPVNRYFTLDQGRIQEDI